MIIEEGGKRLKKYRTGTS